MIQKIRKHSKYIIWIGAEKLFLVGGIIMTIRGIKGNIMGHPLSPWERFCYLACGISDHLSFIVPIILYGGQIIEIFKHFERSMEFWKDFGTQVIYISIRYTIFTGIGRLFYVLSKPTQIKKVWKHRKSEL